ncbi:hypothetical protein CEK26_009756 [Fusarium fujikuroi]|uniref:Phosphoenolpyruvate carboxykinase (ATP) n=1 Tax=Fusarium fujikuroi TaxID=5127 RepID=A0A5Q3DG33_FUSFU|nr:hypothetical protein CEK27_009777 [Fusarium fujikuroi]QGI83047.1 hypothetical protein CEK25_009776 [Fusarium fujikuroi]QGI96687.1 hypothetical protein CEK26_009756 [Fusarium fujikuroi]VTT65798.1 unnamed protein product [Fusarium fujikuroi]VZI18464.1 unnamed protein product [Fusarium fujikuroi]
MNDPVKRSAFLYSNQLLKGPSTQIKASGTGLFKMLPNNVNKTSLHPTGVTPHQEHTELEQELHDKAHIDYDRVAIIPNPSVAALYEDALVYETGTAITSSGALTAYSGAKTGRSPLDKRIVEEASSKDNIWWGPVNKPMTPEVWKINRERAVDYLNTRSRIYVIDGFAGWDEKYRIRVRVICARAYHALFMRNMLIRPSREELKDFHPDYTIYNAGKFPANRYTEGMTSGTSVAINFEQKEMVILGTEYADSTMATLDVSTILLSLLWAALNVSNWINPRFRMVCRSEARLFELFRLVNFSFCPGLLHALQASAPPSIEWFLALDSFAPKNVWGVYIIVLKKRNHPSILYIGSSTAAKRGVRARFYEYDAKKKLGTYVSNALRDGYTIQHKALLAWCQIPEASNIPLYRTVVIALEAVLACYFWAMARRDHDYGFNHLCPWPLESFSYSGACSHNPLKEAIHGDIGLSADELQSLADTVREKNLAYGKKYHTQQRLEATPEFKAAQARANAKHRPKTQKIRQEAVAEKRFHCVVCNLSCSDQSHLNEHNATARHKRRVKEGGKGPHCDICNKSFKYPSDLKAHEKGATHLRNAAAHVSEFESIENDANLPKGEMKKGVFTVLFYEMPIKHNVLTLHSSANEGKNGDVTLFFGLSGTGKTTLSADPNRALIGDDEHCWSDNGVFNIEGGCYAKTIGLSAEKEPDIFGAIRYGSVLENVVFDPLTREVDYDDATLTENTRCAYPIEYISNAKIPCLSPNSPSNIILLTCDARGVLPPISKLDRNQTMFHFISGYTSKMAGTEDGVTEPQATFSSCFAQPFLALHPMKYAKMLADKIETHKANAWLLNTGWVGAGFAQGGKRCPLKYTRAILDAIHSGDLANVEYENYEVFNLQVPKTCPNVPSELLNPSKAWTAGEDSFKTEVVKLGKLFRENFTKYESEATEDVVKAGPVV